MLHDECVICGSSLLGQDRAEGVCSDCIEDGTADIAGIGPLRGAVPMPQHLDESHRRTARLEALADAVRAGLQGLPDHPWIPGAAAKPVRDALMALDGRADQ